MNNPSIGNLDDYVAWLGTFATASELADALRAEGVMGARYTDAFCPLANLARRRGVESPTVYEEAIWSNSAVRRPLPPAATDFVRRFDKKEFADLITKKRR